MRPEALRPGQPLTCELVRVASRRRQGDSARSALRWSIPANPRRANVGAVTPSGVAVGAPLPCREQGNLTRHLARELVDLLLAARADVAAVDNIGGRSALHAAALRPALIKEGSRDGIRMI